MAYREIGMWEILEVLRRVARGERRRAIERVTGHSRNTIRRWLRAARKLGWEPGQGEPDEALATAVAQRVRPVRDEVSPGSSQARLLPHREQIQAWLAPKDDHRGLRLTKVQQLLIRKGVDVPYSSLHRFAVQHCGFADRRRLTVRRAETAPGELAEIDFGRLGLVWDPEAERRRVHYALIVTLVHSRHQYIYVTPSQKIPDLIAGLEEAWAFFGGVTTRVVLDNLKAAVTKADRYDPIFQRTFAEYAAHRGFVIDAAVARHATGKPVVERNVQYLRESFFRGETWLDRDHVQREAIRWCVEVAGQRTHGTTRRRPLVVFENEEKPKLRPLVAGRFDPPVWAKAKVHPDHHIQFRKGLYFSGLLATLPDRVAYAKKAKLSELEFLELALQDEVDRRDQKNLSVRITRAGFEEEQTFEGFDWDAPVTFDRDRIKDLFSLGFLERHEDVIFLGPTGVGKTFLACALGHAACRVGHPVLFLRADRMFQELHQSRADHSTEKLLRRLLAPDLLIVDDFALRRLTAEQSSDIYQVILERHRRASTIVTANRTIDEWIPLFDDPILAQSALDRLAHNAYQIVMEGDSYRKRQRPGEPQAPAPRPRKRRRSL